MKHVPGPWFVSENDDHGDVQLVLQTTSEQDGTPIAYCTVPEDDYDQARADFNFLSSAPDMYEALKGLLEAVEAFQGTRKGDFHHERQDAKAALKKAEGK